MKFLYMLFLQHSLRQLAYQALAVMKIKRYRYDGSQDVCAICLDKYLTKQVSLLL